MPALHHQLDLPWLTHLDTRSSFLLHVVLRSPTAGSIKVLRVSALRQVMPDVGEEWGYAGAFEVVSDYANRLVALETLIVDDVGDDQGPPLSLPASVRIIGLVPRAPYFAFNDQIVASIMQHIASPSHVESLKMIDGGACTRQPLDEPTQRIRAICFKYRVALDLSESSVERCLALVRLSRQILADDPAQCLVRLP